MTVEWLLAAAIMTAASLVYGLTGFGLGLVALAMLPFLLPASEAVPMVNLYGALLALLVLVHLRREVLVPEVATLLAGTLAGVPAGVWLLASVPASTAARLVGAVLVLVVALEWLQVFPARLVGRRWAMAAGFAAGVLGGAVGTPGPPVILYVTAQGWSPRTIRANLQAFFTVNQRLTAVGHGVAGLLTPPVLAYGASLMLPALAGLWLGTRLSARVDQTTFRRLVFALVFCSGVGLLVRG